MRTDADPPSDDHHHDHDRPLLDVDQAPAPDFGLTDRFGPLEGEAHAHGRHQLLYARVGTLHLRTAEARWVLPPARAAWIPAGAEHRVRCDGPVEMQSVYLTGHRLAEAPATVRVFEVDDLARTLVAEAQRFGPELQTDLAARARVARFFDVLADYALEWSTRGQGTARFRLPVGRTPPVQRALDYTLAHLAEADLPAAARAAGQSPRTLERHLKAETGQGWRDLLRAARLWQAMALLSAGQSVTEVALAVGYDSPSAFTFAFRALTGESPTRWRAGAAGH